MLAAGDGVDVDVDVVLVYVYVGVRCVIVGEIEVIVYVVVGKAVMLLKSKLMMV